MNIKIEVLNIKTDKNFYSFDYKIWIDKKLIDNGYYEADHSWGTKHKQFRKILEKGEAYKLALEQTLWER